jgi:hypothetical protein
VNYTKWNLEIIEVRANGMQEWWDRLAEVSNEKLDGITSSLGSYIHLRHK